MGPEEGISALAKMLDEEKVEAKEDPVAGPVEKEGDGVPAADDEETESSESDAAPGEIKVSTGGRKVRRRATAQDRGRTCRNSTRRSRRRPTTRRSRIFGRRSTMSRST